MVNVVFSFELVYLFIICNQKKISRHVLSPFLCKKKLYCQFAMQVEQIDDVACNLAQVIATERTLIEECGNLLYQAQNLQVWTIN